METTSASKTIVHRDRTITTFVVHEAAAALADMDPGEVLEVVTDDFIAFPPDIAAWCAAVGHRLVETREDEDRLRFFIEKGQTPARATRLSMVISLDGLEELLSPLGFALGAALEGIHVSLYFQGPAVRVLTREFRPRLEGWGRPFSRFAAAGMARTGHIAPHEKLGQLIGLGADLYVCGGSLDHFKVRPGDFAFDDVKVVEYLTFMAVMAEADIHMYT